MIKRVEFAQPNWQVFQIPKPIKQNAPRISKTSAFDTKSNYWKTPFREFKFTREGYLTTAFFSLRRDGVSRSSFWKPRRSPDWAKPWMVVSLADLDLWSGCLCILPSPLYTCGFLLTLSLSLPFSDNRQKKDGRKWIEKKPRREVLEGDRFWRRQTRHARLFYFFGRKKYARLFFWLFTLLALFPKSSKVIPRAPFFI